MEKVKQAAIENILIKRNPLVKRKKLQDLGYYIAIERLELENN